MQEMRWETPIQQHSRPPHLVGMMLRAVVLRKKTKQREWKNMCHPGMKNTYNGTSLVKLENAENMQGHLKKQKPKL